MAKSISPKGLQDALSKELTIYHEEVTERVNALSEQAVEELVKKTKATAPKRTGSFRRNIASKKTEDNGRGATFTWYVKAPDHRLTHLLVHGHAKRNGGRVKGDPFLKNALDDILPDYEKNVEEAIKNGR